MIELIKKCKRSEKEIKPLEIKAIKLLQNKKIIHKYERKRNYKGNQQQK